MRHNKHNITFKFSHEPVEFNKWTDKATLQYCLGAILYMPGTKSIIGKILANEISELKSMVMCFEDAISEQELSSAEENVLFHLDALASALDNKKLNIDDLPLIFVRVRNIEQFYAFSEKLTKRLAQVLTGFVFPKFYSVNAHAYLDKLQELNKNFETILYGMPILEGKNIAYSETRSGELENLKLILDKYQKYILNIRIGGTDFSSLFGVRRGINTSVYDILPVRDAISDILNFFSRIEDNYTVSAPVWEYFLAYADDDIKQYIGDNIHHSILSKEKIVNEAIDGLLREILQDKTNGMVGKTVIHPSHLRFVNAMQAITLEEFEDATQILQAKGGVIKSLEGNKMNEVGPHKSWAEKVILRAKAYGVIESENDYLELFKG